MDENSLIEAGVVSHIFDRMPVVVRRILTDDDPVSAELARNPMIKNTMRLDAHYDFLKRLVVDLLAWVVKGKHTTISKDMTLCIPANWWEMLKRDHFPRWFIRHYPVKTEDVTQKFFFEQEVRVCPHADVAWPDSQHIEFLEFKPERYPACREGETPTGRDIVFTKPSISDKPPDYEGVSCPNCGLGIDTDGDGDCALCGPDIQNKTERKEATTPSVLPTGTRLWTPGSIGDLIKGYRKAAKLSQKALAEKAGLSRHLVKNIENGAYRSEIGEVLGVMKVLDIPLGVVEKHEQPSLVDAVLNRASKRN